MAGYCSTRGYVRVHVDLEMNREERLQHRRQFYRQQSDREMEEGREERLGRQCEYMYCPYVAD